jgi:hypothetical protein
MADGGWSLLGGGLLGLTLAVVVVLALLVGATLIGGYYKLRRRGPDAARSLDELVGEERHARFLTPEDPRGPVDQLRPAGTSPGSPA